VNGYQIAGLVLFVVIVGPVVLGFVLGSRPKDTVDSKGAARSYDYPVQYEVRIRVTVNAETPEEAAWEAQKLIRDYPVHAEVIDPRGRLSQVVGEGD